MLDRTDLDLVPGVDYSALGGAIDLMVCCAANHICRITLVPGDNSVEDKTAPDLES